jgi:hypothetical protein
VAGTTGRRSWTRSNKDYLGQQGWSNVVLRWLLPLGILIVAAGSVDTPGCVPHRSARDVEADAPSEGGPPGDLLTIQVLDMLNGTPIAGAGVVVLWNHDYIDPDTDNLPDRPRIDYLHLRTDGEGRAYASIPERRFFVVTAAMDGMTEVASDLGDPRDAVDVVTLRLIPLHYEAEATGVYAGPTTADLSDWRPLEFPLAADVGGDGREVLEDSLIGATVTLSWTVGLGDVADFGVGVGHDQQTTDNARDSDQPPIPGSYTETLVLEWRESFFAWDDDIPPLRLETGSVWAGPYAVAPFVSVDGVPFTVKLEADFDTRQRQVDDCGVFFPAAEHV